jgi:prophage antirepressor-like protein
MTELKILAKDRGFTSYNNLKKDELIKNHTDFDELENDKESIDDGGCEESKDNREESVSDDGGASESKENHEDDSVSESKDNRDENKIMEIFKFDDKVIRTVGTYDDPWFVAKDICDILDLKKLDSAIRNIQDEWKGTQVLSTLGGPQEMTIINESAVYKIIMRSNKPIADKFQNFVCGDILPSIRKKGIYEIKDKSKMILQRPVRKLLDLSEIDIEAEELEMKHDWSLYTNKCVLYIAYIGKSLVKVGYSDCNIHQREKKHTSCESQYEQFRMIKAFEISGEPV